MALPVARPATRQNTTKTKDQHAADHNNVFGDLKDIVDTLGGPGNALTAPIEAGGPEFETLREIILELVKKLRAHDSQFAEIDRADQLYIRSGAPTADLGESGDLYIDYTGARMYRKGSPSDSNPTGWGTPKSLVGVQGPEGRTGPAGPAGQSIKGDRGQQGLPGKDGRDGSDGMDGRDSTIPGPAGKDGAPGKDGAIAKVQSVDKDMPVRGTISFSKAFVVKDNLGGGRTIIDIGEVGGGGHVIKAAYEVGGQLLDGELPQRKNLLFKQADAFNVEDDEAEDATVVNIPKPREVDSSAMALAGVSRMPSGWAVTLDSGGWLKQASADTDNIFTVPIRLVNEKMLTGWGFADVAAEGHYGSRAFGLYLDDNGVPGAALVLSDRIQPPSVAQAGYGVRTFALPATKLGAGAYHVAFQTNYPFKSLASVDQYPWIQFSTQNASLVGLSAVPGTGLSYPSVGSAKNVGARPYYPHTNTTSTQKLPVDLRELTRVTPGQQNGSSEHVSRGGIAIWLKLENVA